MVQVDVSEGGLVPQEIATKALRPVTLNIRSLDSSYQVVLPSLTSAVARVPARGTASLSFDPIKEGTYQMEVPGYERIQGMIVVSLCPPEARIPNPLPGTAASLETGRRLFSANCTSCHGEGARATARVPKT